MFSIPTHVSPAVELEAGPCGHTGSALVLQAEVASLLTTPFIVAVTSTVVEMLAVFGVIVWGVALVLLVVSDVRKSAHRRDPSRPGPRWWHGHSRGRPRR